jgi:hypothetical protein
VVEAPDLSGYGIDHILTYPSDIPAPADGAPQPAADY